MLAATVTFSIITMFLTKELVMATEECTDYQFKSPFLPGESCEAIYSKNPENHDKPGYYWILSREYCGMNYTGSSCENIYNKYPETHGKSGYYRINANWIFCEMANSIFISQCGGGGWKMIANIDVTKGDRCPTGWTKATDTQSGISFCRVNNVGNTNFCSSTKFSSNGITYQKVCGRVRGYQKGFVWAFHTGSKSIDDYYVSGISITNELPRQHIWTYGTGFAETVSTRCPCEGGKSPPSFVGNNYYCESGSVNHPPSGETFFFNDTLWDGKGCFNTHVTCCDDTSQPWFYRQLDYSTQSDIEARICVVGPFPRSSTVIDQLELYIQ